MNLGDLSQGRNNNFNLIRMAAALAVLVGHSFPLADGAGSPEPLQSMLGMSLGAMAVDVFFVASGFLITSSLLSRDIFSFIWSRVLRVFPALFSMLVLTVFLMGVVFTSLSVIDYLFSPVTRTYFLKCLTLFSGVKHFLPGVFEENPYKGAVNGSLWTLPYEVRMYATIAVIWVASRAMYGLRLSVFSFVVVVLALISCLSNLMGFAPFHFKPLPVRLFSMFFMGASFYVLRRRIPISSVIFWGLLAGLLLSAGSPKAFNYLYTLSIGYIVVFVAYFPAGLILEYNRLGDYSYGFYIYAFPVQQSVVALVPGISAPQLMLVSMVVTAVLAVLSWHLLEKRCLGLKKYRPNRDCEARIS